MSQTNTNTKTDPKNEQKEEPSSSTESSESVWTFRGYRMRPSEFNTAMVHFYRGEITRSNVWRTRLDSTTNWAVVTTAAMLTFTFSAVQHSHLVVLLGLLMVSLFLVIEARRYRYYELWSLRVRLMETDFFAAMLMPPFAPNKEWATRIVDSLTSPEYPISQMEAIGRRLRRNYIWIFLILGLAWVLKLLLHPAPAISLDDFLDHAQIGFIPGQIVAIFVLLFFLGVFVVAVFTAGLQDAAGEVFSPQHDSLILPRNILNAASQVFPEDLPFFQRHKQMVTIITNQPQAVSQQLLDILKRGVTGLHGQGMYSGERRTVLLCAITPDEVPRLKNLIYAIDEDAFVVVNPTEQVWGGSFGVPVPSWRQKPKSGDISV